MKGGLQFLYVLSFVNFSGTSVCRSNAVAQVSAFVSFFLGFLFNLVVLLDVTPNAPTTAKTFRGLSASKWHMEPRFK